MGSALTYARRHALFTFVGIAGEGDLDAPDLAEGAKAEATNKAGAADKDAAAARLRPAAVAQERQPGASAPRRRTEELTRPARTLLEPEQSAVLRERLLADLRHFQSDDEAADWVHRNLAAKNTLVAIDTEHVEARFREKLATINSKSAGLPGESQSTPGEESKLRSKNLSPPRSTTTPEPRSSRPGPPARDVAALRPRPFASATRSTASSSPPQPCLVCGRTPSEAHHVRFAQPRARP